MGFDLTSNSHEVVVGRDGHRTSGLDTEGNQRVFGTVPDFLPHAAQLQLQRLGLRHSLNSLFVCKNKFLPNNVLRTRVSELVDSKELVAGGSEVGAGDEVLAAHKLLALGNELLPHQPAVGELQSRFQLLILVDGRAM